MAEKFEKPKRFTKKWWEYFWEYYKWYVIVGAFIIISVAVTVFQVSNQPDYIFNITYAGEGYIPEEISKPLMDELAEGISTEEDEGILFTQLNFDYSQNADAQLTSAMEQKLQLEFVTDETMLFLFDKAKLEQMMNSESFENVWVPVSDWAENIPSDELISNEYGVCLKNSEILQKHGIKGENIYVAVRNCYNTDDEDALKRHSYSIEAANRLLAE